ncbi:MULTISPECIES: neutral zinc metallopeptidase [unclassified Massilia]|uniref:KPN_02809 family neutral zinc metallopeptidase n=1 Tax=unclassified Massilia TaxID=2609279 RepID=UPI001786A74D|nr:MULTISPECIES: neutral zinc metallopeptidase [unclassified Massilia]MBD8532134.1 neutral zinc metallopeptidase [Massilia sp. CFBP 13647]MBD8675608.1 neutral zinc metallopeptidase [Massilia sp. CFBP 13721]
MKWEGDRESSNVEDNRGGGGGGGGGFNIGGRGIGLGTVAIALVASLVFGVDPGTVLGMLGGGGPAPQVQQQRDPNAPQATDRESRFVRTVLAYTEDAWTPVFAAQGETYRAPTLQLFEGRTQTACGAGNAATGPFYCPADQKVYIDLSFFRLMEERFKVGGEFAQAYVIAHEVGHHVQKLVGVSDQVHRAQAQASETEGNALSVRLELQADCFAGVWANKTQQKEAFLEQGDIESALATASAIGDDALQRQARGTVVPDSFTHGSSEQRVRWFKRGFDGGDVKQCNTFEARQL